MPLRLLVSPVTSSPCQNAARRLHFPHKEEILIRFNELFDRDRLPSGLCELCIPQDLQSRRIRFELRLFQTAKELMDLRRDCLQMIGAGRATG